MTGEHWDLALWHARVRLGRDADADEVERLASVIADTRTTADLRWYQFAAMAADAIAIVLGIRQRTPDATDDEVIDEAVAAMLRPRGEG